jgi:RNA polymerase sigma factor (sigma-70 family)
MKLHLVKAPTEPDRGEPRRDGLDELYACHASDVKRWARRLAGPYADLDDLVHDVFVVALRRRFTFRGDGTLKTWLFRITHHVVRSRMRHGFLRGLLFHRHEQALIAATPSPSTPHEEIERHEQHARLYAALDRMSDAYRTTIILYEIEGLSGEEVAELLGVSVGTVWVRLHRGREQLLGHLRAGEG